MKHRLPATVVAQFTGWPIPGRWETVFPLLTSDPGGEPRVCLLSRAEIEAEPTVLRCAVRSRRTAANLQRTGVAVLHVVAGTVCWSIRTRLGRVVLDDGMAAELLVTALESDTLDIPLRPFTFLANSELAATERWDENIRLFAMLASVVPEAEPNE